MGLLSPPWLASGWPQPFHPAHISAGKPFMKPPSFNHQDGFYFQPDTRALFQNLFLNSGVPGDRAEPSCVCQGPSDHRRVVRS